MLVSYAAWILAEFSIFADGKEISAKKKTTKSAKE